MRKGKPTAAEAFSLIESITANSKFYSVVNHLCDVAIVSRSVYYSFLKTKDLKEQRLSEYILARDIVLKAFDHRGYKKGSRSIKTKLESEFGITYGRKRI